MRATTAGAALAALALSVPSWALSIQRPDVAARALYESCGFTNREGGPGGPVMYVYERDV